MKENSSLPEPPVFKPKSRPMERDGNTDTTVKQNVKAIRPEKPRFKSCPYPIWSITPASASVGWTSLLVGETTAMSFDVEAPPLRAEIGKVIAGKNLQRVLLCRHERKGFPHFSMFISCSVYGTSATHCLTREMSIKRVRQGSNDVKLDKSTRRFCRGFLGECLFILHDGRVCWISNPVSSDAFKLRLRSLDRKKYHLIMLSGEEQKSKRPS